MILSQGHTVYLGPAATSTDYFAAISPELECPARYNPADYFMQLTCESLLVVMLSRFVAVSVSLTLVLSFCRRGCGRDGRTGEWQVAHRQAG